MNHVLPFVLASVFIQSGAVDAIKREIKASPGQTLELRLQTGGNVHIVGWDQPLVSVNVVFKGRAEDYRMDVRPTARGVEVASRYATRGDGTSSADFTIRVPRRFDVVLDSMGGALRVTDVNGDIRGRTMGGELILDRVRGRLDLSTLGGEIRLTASQVDGSLSTNGGNVVFEDVVGDVKGSSLGGNVIYRNVRPTGTAAGPKRAAASRNGEEVRISTNGGEVNVEEAPAGANVLTMGGNIHIRDARRHVKATTMGGDIRIEAIDGWIEAETMGGDVTATMVGNPASGDRHVVLSSKSGDIALVVPEGLGMQIDVTLAYTRNSRKDYRITSDFELQRRETSDWDYSSGTPRRYVYGTGTIGSGRHRVRIETINGDVTIRKTPSR